MTLKQTLIEELRNFVKKDGVSIEVNCLLPFHIDRINAGLKNTAHSDKCTDRPYGTILIRNKNNEFCLYHSPTEQLIDGLRYTNFGLSLNKTHHTPLYEGDFETIEQFIIDHQKNQRP